MKTIDFGVKAVILHDNKFLAVKRIDSSDGSYDLPGAFMEFGETIEQSVKRAIKEELQVEVTPIKLIDTWNYLSDDKSYQATGIIYLCVAYHLEDLALLKNYDQFEWFECGDVKQMNQIIATRMEHWDWDIILKK